MATLKDIHEAGLILIRNRCDPEVMAMWLRLEYARWRDESIRAAWVGATLTTMPETYTVTLKEDTMLDKIPADATCSHCGRRVARYANGTIYRHRDRTINSFTRGAICQGSQKPPKEEA